MFNDNKKMNLCKIIVILLILIFCLIPYFRSNKLDNKIDSNTDSNEEIKNEDNGNDDYNKEEQDVNDKELANALNNDSTTQNKEDSNVGSNNNDKKEDKNTNSDVENSKDNDVSSKKIILVDKTNGASCAQAIEYFYEDSEYRYYFTCIKSNSMYVIVNGVEYKLVYALENDIVTIKELESSGYKFLKKSKNLQIR